MILESSNYDFWTLRAAKHLAGNFFKNPSFLMAWHRKYGFLYDKIILEAANYDFWILRIEKHLAGFPFKNHSFLMTQHRKTWFSLW